MTAEARCECVRKRGEMEKRVRTVEEKEMNMKVAITHLFQHPYMFYFSLRVQVIDRKAWLVHGVTKRATELTN